MLGQFTYQTEDLMITTEALRGLVKQAGEKHEADLHHLEVTYFLGGFINTFGIEAIDVAMKSHERRCEVLTFPNGKFDLKTHPRPQFLRQLQGCSGLAERTCEEMLSAIESLLHEKLAQSSTVEFERLGTIERSEGGGFALILGDGVAARQVRRRK